MVKLAPPLSSLKHHHEKFLSTLHALTGRDVTSKVGTKKMLLRIKNAGHTITLQGLLTLGFDILKEEMIASAESLLVDCVMCDTKGMSTFDELRHPEYHKSKVIDLRNFPCTPSMLRSQMKRAQLGAYISRSLQLCLIEILMKY